MTEVYIEPPSATKFKYDSTIIFGHLECPPKEKSDQHLEVGDTSAFEAELMQSLLQATQAARVTRQWISDAFHWQSDQYEEEDHSHKFTSFYTHNYSEKANSNLHVKTDVEAAEHETDNELEEETDND
ncbi:hypothetical protein BGX38DRAFT_1146780 [Terfezia claveryi]|nr:hypothetical protein BGX38DRAFT_1146780 [Terfezia claveryi]